MQRAEIRILSTRPVSEEAIRAAAGKGIQLEVLSFIETKPLLTIPVVEQVQLAGMQPHTVVFTSMNAVEVVAGLLNGVRPDWRVYCIGNTTRKLVESFWGAGVIAGTAEDATRLAAKIVAEESSKELLFFCGDQRRDELPAHLAAEGISVREVVVYKTIPRHEVVRDTYDAVLFFSPSAVESFFYANTLSRETVLFAIGTTTAETIRQYGDYTVITAVKPGKELLVDQAVDYFTTGKTIPH